MRQTSQASTIETLKQDEKIANWIGYLAEIGPSPEALPIPDERDLRARFAYLAVPPDDLETLVALRPTIANDPDLLWILDRAVHSLTLNLDVVATVPGFPVLPTSLGEIADFFYVYVYAMALPATLALHERHGVPSAVSEATMADIGRNMLVHRKRHGRHGLAAPDWLMLHARGMIFQFGRLQFERAKLGTRTGDAIQAAGFPFRTGDPTLSIHIPDFMGSMSVEACDESFAAARAFFPAHYPDEDVRTAVCNSWILDPQLRDYLRLDSNILRFQDRFTEIRPAEWTNDGPLRFVFGPTDLPLEDYPQRSSVERAVVGHIAAGKNWHGGMGWLKF
ncbi:MAG TPA: acyltransferase domain-containing protein [Thermomicrobiales bacterium]|nr:acyltransferase domain-containing protein [Thermomicrobiales bacterium]